MDEGRLRPIRPIRRNEARLGSVSRLAGMPASRSGTASCFFFSNLMSLRALARRLKRCRHALKNSWRRRMAFFFDRQWRGKTLSVEPGMTQEASASHKTSRAGREESKLPAFALVACLMLSTVSLYGVAQQAAAPAAAVAPPVGMKDLPTTPAPNYTEPMYMRSTSTDFTKARNYFPNPLTPYKSISVEPARFTNSSLPNLVRNGKIYLSLSDAITLALENNYDIAIARYNLDIADTDILLSKAGQPLRGVNAGIVAGTLGGA